MQNFSRRAFLQSASATAIVASTQMAWSQSSSTRPPLGKIFFNLIEKLLAKEFDIPFPEMTTMERDESLKNEPFAASQIVSLEEAYFHPDLRQPKYKSRFGGFFAEFSDPVIFLKNETTRTRTRALTRTRTRTRTRSLTRTHTRTRTRSGQFNQADGGFNFQAFAVKDEKYLSRIDHDDDDRSDLSDILETLLDKPKFVSKTYTKPDEFEEKIREQNNDKFEALTQDYSQLSPPPAPSAEEAIEELKLLKEFQNQRKSNSVEAQLRMSEAEAEATDIFTPFTDVFTNELGTPGGVLRLMLMIEKYGHKIVSHYKDKYQRPRPSETGESDIVPQFQNPNHYSYPSGHALQAYLIAHTLSDIMGDRGEYVAKFHAIADRIAENREFAGVHFKSDSEASKDIADLVFPVIRVWLSDLFMAATRDVSESDEANCQFDMRAVFRPRSVETLGSTSDQEKLKRSGIYPWHLRVIDEQERAKADEYPENHSAIALIDTAVDITHPSLLGVTGNSTHNVKKIEPENLFNVDHPSPLSDATAFGSTGTGHGTAMASILAGKAGVEINGDEYNYFGVSPNSRLLLGRVTSVLNHTALNKITLSRCLIDMAFADVMPSVILIAPPIERPAEDDFIKFTPGSKFVAKEDEGKLPCDPFILTLMIVSEITPIVLPAGNYGTGELGYPGNPSDYARVAEVLNHKPLGRKMALEMFLDICQPGILDDDFAKSIADPLTKSNVGKFLSDGIARLSNGIRPALQNAQSQADFFGFVDRFTNVSETAFDDTGIIVVGAGTVPLNDQFMWKDEDGVARPVSEHAPLKRSSYSQYGNGLFCIAPSNGEFKPYEPCIFDDLPEFRPRSVPVASIRGWGGYSTDPNALYSSAHERNGFGGTSAASAQVAGVVARMYDGLDKQAYHDVSFERRSGPKVREKLREHLVQGKSVDWDGEFGWGTIKVGATV